MFLQNIVNLAKENTNFRKVIYTGRKSQLVLMSIPPGGEVGDEIHPQTDQILFFVKGYGEAIVAGEMNKIYQEDVVFVPAGTEHNFKNIGDEDLKLYTIYSPPAHPDKIVEQTREEAKTREG